MSKIRFENGQVVNFEGTPTTKDIEEVAAKLGITPAIPVAPVTPAAPVAKGVSGAGGLAVGAGKGVGSTLFTAPQAFQKITGAVTTRLTKPGGIPQEQASEAERLAVEAYYKATPEQRKLFNLTTPEEISRASLAAREARLAPVAELQKDITAEKPKFLKPVGTAEKIGFGVEQIGEFFVPGGASTRAMAALSKTAAAEKLRGLGKLGTAAAEVLTRAVPEAVGAGVVTAAQTGETKKATDAAIISAAFPVAGKLFSEGKKLTQPITRALGARVINSLIKPLAKDFSYGKNPGRTVAELGIAANNLDELTSNISKKRSEIGEQIGQVLSRSKATIDIGGLFEPISKAITKAKEAARVNAPLISRLEAARDDLLDYITKKSGGGPLGRFEAKDAVGLKGLIGDITKWTGQASDDNTVNAALKNAYGIVKEQIEKKVPATTKLNGQYADLISAEVASKYREALVQRQNLVSLPVKAGTITGLMTAIATGGAALPTIFSGIAAGTIEKAFESPAVKTRVASWLAKATPAQKKALFDANPVLKGLIIKNFIGE